MYHITTLTSSHLEKIQETLNRGEIPHDKEKRILCEQLVGSFKRRGYEKIKNVFGKMNMKRLVSEEKDV